MDADILKNAVFAVAVVADGKKERGGWRRKGKPTPEGGGPT